MHTLVSHLPVCVDDVSSAERDVNLLIVGVDNFAVTVVVSGPPVHTTKYQQLIKAMIL